MLESTVNGPRGVDLGQIQSPAHLTRFNQKKRKKKKENISGPYTDMSFIYCYYYFARRTAGRLNWAAPNFTPSLVGQWAEIGTTKFTSNIHVLTFSLELHNWDN